MRPRRAFGHSSPRAQRQVCFGRKDFFELHFHLLDRRRPSRTEGAQAPQGEALRTDERG
jgi:hypothetical protein